MKLLVLVLNKTEDLNELLEKFLDMGIRGATVIDSHGMGRILSTHVPLFGGLSHLFDGDRPVNKVVFSIIDNEEKVRQAIELTNKIIGDLKEPGTGVIFTLELDQVVGLAGDISRDSSEES